MAPYSRLVSKNEPTQPIDVSSTTMSPGTIAHRRNPRRMDLVLRRIFDHPPQLIVAVVLLDREQPIPCRQIDVPLLARSHDSSSSLALKDNGSRWPCIRPFGGTQGFMRRLGIAA